MLVAWGSIHKTYWSIFYSCFGNQYLELFYLHHNRLDIHEINAGLISDFIVYFILEIMLMLYHSVLNVFFFFSYFLNTFLFYCLMSNVLRVKYLSFFSLFNVISFCCIFRSCLSLSGQFQGMLSHKESMPSDMGIQLICYVFVVAADVCSGVDLSKVNHGC